MKDIEASFQPKIDELKQQLADANREYDLWKASEEYVTASAYTRTARLRRVWQISSAIDALIVKRDRTAKAASKIPTILKKAGLQMSQSRTTAVKGYRDVSKGFKVRSCKMYNQDYAEIYVTWNNASMSSIHEAAHMIVSQSEIDRAVKALIDNGYEVQCTSHKIIINNYNAKS